MAQTCVGTDISPNSKVQRSWLGFDARDIQIDRMISEALGSNHADANHDAQTSIDEIEAFVTRSCPCPSRVFERRLRSVLTIQALFAPGTFASKIP